jgi:hypothetical protein
MSPDLIAFLKAWHDWATSGAPDGEPFQRCFGLCTNCRDNFGENAWESLVGALEEEFGDSCDPFGYYDYSAREKARTQHLCPKRLAWVRERLIEAGELVA